LQAGARWPTKLWPEQYWFDLVALADKELPHVRFAVLGGSESEMVLGHRLESSFPRSVSNLTGFRPWKELVQLFSEMIGLVGPDTGPLHLAAASGTPVCALMGPTRPDWTGPFGHGHQVLQERDLDCVPCMKRRCEYRESLACMKRISPETVLSVVRGWTANQDAS
jgi:ADP-heptose:LPS heptosyltransferase